MIPQSIRRRIPKQTTQAAMGPAGRPCGQTRLLLIATCCLIASGCCRRAAGVERGVKPLRNRGGLWWFM